MFAATLDELRQEERTKYESYQAELEDLQRKCEEKEEQVDQERILLMQYKKEVALSAINSRTGKSIPGKVLLLPLSAHGKICRNQLSFSSVILIRNYSSI